MSSIRSLQEDQDLDLEALLDPYIYVLLGLESMITMISFFGAAFIIVTYLKFPNIRTFAFKLVTYISCSDFLFYLGRLLSIVEVSTTNPQTLCKFQGVIMSFGQLASVLWSAVIAFTLYSTVLKQKHHFEEKYFRNFLYFAAGIPGFMTLLLWAFGLIGGNGDRCWIIFDVKHRWNSWSLQMVTFYFPLWAVIGFNTYVYIKLIKYLKKFNLKVSKKRIALYPLILIICWFFPTLHVIQTSFGYESEFMNALHNFCESLQGILNAIIYGMNTDVRREWKKFLNRNFGLYPRYNEPVESNTHSEIKQQEVSETPLDPLDQNPYFDFDDFDNYDNDYERRNKELNDSKQLRRDSSWEIEMNLRLAQKNG